MQSTHFRCESALWPFSLPLALVLAASACGEPGPASPATADTQAAKDAAVDATDAAALDAAADVGPPNKPPEATDDLAATSVGTAVEIDVLDNDSDSPGDKLKVTEVTQGKHGTVAITLSGKAVEYTPLDDVYVGLDDFTYTVSDGKGGLDTGAVTVNIKPPPTLVITAPKAGEVVKGTAVQVEFKVTGCKFTSPSDDADGCHGHRYLDKKTYAPPGKTGPGQYEYAPIQLTPLTPGEHTFTMQLHQNDGSDAAWVPPVSASVTFTVE